MNEESFSAPSNAPPLPPDCARLQPRDEGVVGRGVALGAFSAAWKSGVGAIVRKAV